VGTDPRLLAATAIAALAAIGVIAVAVHNHNRGQSPAPIAAAPPPASVAESPSPQQSPPAPHPASPPATYALPTCQTTTATNCDGGSLQQSAGTNGAAGCTGRGTAIITASPVDLDEILYIQPMGLMTGGHVSPIDHGYFYIKGAMEQPPRQAAVKSPLDGVITAVTRTARQGPNGDYDDYAVTIDATCTFRVRFSNLVRFAGGLQDAVGQLQPDQSTAPDYRVRAGDIIGYTGMPTAYGIDVWVENDESTLPGFINPQQYAAAEAWKLHMVDLFDYTAEPLRSQLLALDLRDAAPRWGKIDYDVDGRLVGNWFRQGSGGYGGNRQGSEGYWDGHLSVVYDGNDPTQIIVSIGNYQGQPQQFAVIGNSPDPAAVTQATGVVKYELGQIVNYSGDTGELWDHKSYIAHIRTRAGASVEATILLQLISDRQLKVEIFPGKRASEVQTFDAAAQLYER
jgi:hypothetical protein